MASAGAPFFSDGLITFSFLCFAKSSYIYCLDAGIKSDLTQLSITFPIDFGRNNPMNISQLPQWKHRLSHHKEVECLQYEQLVKKLELDMDSSVDVKDALIAFSEEQFCSNKVTFPFHKVIHFFKLMGS